MSQIFGAGMGPILWDNIACDRSHLVVLLNQCVHPADIGIHNCDRGNVAGVICPTITTITDIPSTTLRLFSTTLISTNTVTQNIDLEVYTTVTVTASESMLIK